MNYKQRVLIEYSDLLSKIVYLKKYLENKNDELLEKQLVSMFTYKDILEQRLFIFLEDKKEPTS